MAQPSPSVNFGRVVRDARSELGLTQEELADASGLHRNYVGGLERGERNPTLPVVFKIANGLGLKASELIAAVEAEGGR